MTKIIGIAFIAATTIITACAPESTEDRTAEEALEAAEAQNTEHIGDVAPATQEAVSDTQAAINEASGDIGEAFPATEQETGTVSQ